MKINFHPSSDLLINFGKNSLQKKDYFNLLDDFFSNFGFYINIGGNIYDFPYIFDFIDYANKKGVKSIGIYVRRLKEEYARKFVELKVRAIMLPMQSILEKENDLLLGEGSYQTALKSIDIAKKYGLGVEIIYVADKNALKTIPQLIDMMVKKRIDMLVIARSIMAKHYGLSLEEFPHKDYKKLLYYLVKNDRKLRNSNQGKISLMSCPHKILLQKSQQRLDVMGGCSAGSISCYISPEGKVHPCAALSDITAGYLKKERFLEIWGNSDIFKDFMTRNKLKGKCKKCKYKLKCGGCRADALDEFKDLWEEDPNCWI
ncbi:MAG: radical SAM/SPASM domain-containing protein [Minisyncoccales bacterium]|jgi:radical SAM protein with 4Fe4S-binding SPASM domain